MNNPINISNLTSQIPQFQIYLWPLAICFIMGGVGALFGNIMIISALLKSKELGKNRCNAFVGNLAFADGICSFYFIIYGASALNASIHGLDAVAISNELCYFINIPAIFSFDAGSLIVLAIGIDRMTSLWWPLFYKNLTIRYVVLTNAASWIFGLVNAVLGGVYKDPNRMVPACAQPTALNDVAFAFWNDANILINILVVASYACAFRRAKSLASIKSTNTDQILRNNRLLTSLVICVVIYIVGWMVTMVVIFLVHVLEAPESVTFHCEMYVGILANINVGCNFYVYYARSDEYRRAFKKMVGLKATETTTVHAINNSVHQPTKSAW